MSSKKKDPGPRLYPYIAGSAEAACLDCCRFGDFLSTLPDMDEARGGRGDPIAVEADTRNRRHRSARFFHAKVFLSNGDEK